MANKMDLSSFGIQLPSQEALNKGLIDGAEAMLSVQTKLFGAFEALTASWLQRQRDAFAEAHQQLQTMRSASSPAEMMQAQQAWVASSMKRMSADMAALGQATTTMTQHALQEIGANSKQAMSFIETGRQDMLRAAGNKPGKR